MRCTCCLLILTLWSAAAGFNNRMPICIGSFSFHSKWIGLSKRDPNSSVLRRDVETDRLIGNRIYTFHDPLHFQWNEIIFLLIQLFIYFLIHMHYNRLWMLFHVNIKVVCLFIYRDNSMVFQGADSSLGCILHWAQIMKLLNGERESEWLNKRGRMRPLAM